MGPDWRGAGPPCVQADEVDGGGGDCLVHGAFDAGSGQIALFPLVVGLLGSGVLDRVVNVSGTQHQLTAGSGRSCALWMDRTRPAGGSGACPRWPPGCSSGPRHWAWPRRVAFHVGLQPLAPAAWEPWIAATGDVARSVAAPAAVYCLLVRATTRGTTFGGRDPTNHTSRAAAAPSRRLSVSELIDHQKIRAQFCAMPVAYVAHALSSEPNMSFSPAASNSI